MGRQGGFFANIAREAARAQRAADKERRHKEVAHRRTIRELERETRRLEIEEEKEAKKQYTSCLKILSAQPSRV